MNDLVKRLRDYGGQSYDECTDTWLAADEIERLRAREARLLKVLAHYACKCSPEAYEHCCYGEDSVTCGYFASEALAEQEKTK